ncbi:unnamed protein product [Oncorhynchus mykiss]|uniref:T-box domain-containing protein n=1 Tax=Oncorhynchus mykiss TaxID=8022 RepID=A0A060XU00_ONCMY|nr:unnamed protein product [Oncorhynchus mykiss]
MSDRRRSAAALSSRAHAFSVEALIGSNKKRKLRAWEEKELELSMESLATNGQLGDGDDPAHCLDIDPDSEASPGSDGEGLAERTSCSFGSPADLAPAACEPSPAASMEEIQVELQCADLWKRFHEIGTEMIITKAGRRMFPAMRVKIVGLDPHQQYYIAMDIVPVDNKRYRYAPIFLRTGLEAIMETYAFWRPPVRTLTFEDFTNMQKQQGGSTGTSPTTSSTGTPSPSGAAHLLSPSCSPPTFHLAPNTFNVGCRESQLCSMGLSEYPACARSNMAALQGYGGLADSSYGRLQAAGGTVASTQQSESFLPQRTSSLIAAGMQGGGHGSLSSGSSGSAGGKMDAYGGQLTSFPASQLQYVMQAGSSSASGSSSSGSSPSSAHMFSGGHHHVQQGSYNAFSLHNPYNLYGYNFPTSPRLATSPEKPQGGLLCSSSPAGAFAERQYLSNGGMDSMHMIGNPSTGQQGAGSCDGRQYGSSSQMSMHIV